jgi:hypothetical protein
MLRQPDPDYLKKWAEKRAIKPPDTGYSARVSHNLTNLRGTFGGLMANVVNIPAFLGEKASQLYGTLGALLITNPGYTVAAWSNKFQNKVHRTLAGQGGSPGGS